MLDHITLSKSRAASIFETFTETNLESPERLGRIAKELQQDLEAAYQSIQDDVDVTKDRYKFDLYYGLEMYELLQDKYHFTERIASQPNFWRYLSICMIPHVVYQRQGLKEKVFYEDTTRIWLRQIWWYIHLSWQGDKEATYEILKNNTTDTVVQLVDRSGKRGFKINLTRHLMYELGTRDIQQKEKVFRQIMKLNTAQLSLIEPELVIGGIRAYTSNLFSYVKYNKGASL